MEQHFLLTQFDVNILQVTYSGIPAFAGVLDFLEANVNATFSGPIAEIVEEIVGAMKDHEFTGPVEEYESGYIDGKEDGYDSGYYDGYDAGHEVGYSAGYDAGQGVEEDF